MREILILVFTVLYTIASGQTANDSKTQHIYQLNKVKNQESWDYKYNGKILDKNGSRTSVTTFTATGEIARVVTYNTNGQVLHVEKYSYDKMGNRTEYTRMSSEDSGKPAYQKLSVYDAKGKLLQESGFDGVENFKNVYTYNGQGDLSEILYYTGDRVKEKRTFVTEGNTTSVMVYNGTGILISKLMMKYDDRRNLIEESVYGVDKSELEKKLYDYDENQNLKEEANYKLEKITLRTSYNYNTSGDLIAVYEQSAGNDKFQKKSYTYDNAGNLLQLKWRRNADDDFNQMTYTYDKNGICSTVDTYYPDPKYRVLTKYVYAYY